jgi:hypothetical protein
MALAGEARKHILQLRQLHLQTPFGCPRAVSEYVENQLGAVDDFNLNGVFEVTLLSGREVVIDDQDVGLVGLGELFQFLHLAVAEQSGRVEDGTGLKHVGDNRGAGAGGQFGKLAKRLGGSRGRRSAAAFEAREDRFFRVLFQ